MVATSLVILSLNENFRKLYSSCKSYIIFLFSFVPPSSSSFWLLSFFSPLVGVHKSLVTRLLNCVLLYFLFKRLCQRILRKNRVVSVNRKKIIRRFCIFGEEEREDGYPTRSFFIFINGNAKEPKLPLAISLCHLISPSPYPEIIALQRLSFFLVCNKINGWKKIWNFFNVKR